MKKSRHLRIFFIIAAVILTVLLVTGVGFKIYTSHYYVSDMAVIQAIESSVDGKVKSYSDDNGTVFLPEGLEPRAVVIFYPGGKVEYTAYSGLMYELSAKGYICVLLKMPDNLAFLSVDAVDKVEAMRLEQLQTVSDLDWYIGGHSLGGVAASMYLKKDLEKNGSESNYKGLILCASYTTQDLSSEDIRLLSIYGDNDHVLGMEQYEENRANWPKDFREIVIEGGIHSYFGSYGIQKGDGKPALTNVDQILFTADAIDEWINME